MALLFKKGGIIGAAIGRLMPDIHAKPAYRGFGASVQLVCQKFPSVGTCDVQTFPSNCDGPCSAQVDACGNFRFTITTCDTNPQLDNTNICTFVVHVDQAHVPNACSNKPPPPA